MMTSNINSSPLWLQTLAINRTLLELNIERLEDEILAFEDLINYAIHHPEKEPEIPFNIINDKISKLGKLQSQLAELSQTSQVQ